MDTQRAETLVARDHQVHVAVPLATICRIIRRSRLPAIRSALRAFRRARRFPARPRLPRPAGGCRGLRRVEPDADVEGRVPSLRSPARRNGRRLGGCAFRGPAGASEATGRQRGRASGHDEIADLASLFSVSRGRMEKIFHCFIIMEPHFNRRHAAHGGLHCEYDEQLRWALSSQPARTSPCSRTPRPIDALYRRHRLRVMLAITLGYGVIYTCRLALGVVKKPLIDAGIFGPADLGLIGSALFYTYALGKLTNGFLADHANMKRFLAAGFLLTALCNLAHGLLDGRVGVGVGVGTERLVPELRRARRRSGDDGVVQQSRARPLLRHLEHGALDRRRTDLHRRRHDRRRARLALGILGAGAGRHRNRRDGVHAAAGSAAHARTADGRRVAQRSLRDCARARTAASFARSCRF